MFTKTVSSTHSPLLRFDGRTSIVVHTVLFPRLQHGIPCFRLYTTVELLPRTSVRTTQNTVTSGTIPYYAHGIVGTNRYICLKRVLALPPIYRCCIYDSSFYINIDMRSSNHNAIFIHASLVTGSKSIERCANVNFFNSLRCIPIYVESVLWHVWHYGNTIILYKNKNPPSERPKLVFKWRGDLQNFRHFNDRLGVYPIFHDL